MKLLLLGCYYLLSGTLIAHGDHSASYHYTFADETLHLEFRIERSNLEHFKFDRQCENFSTATAFCLAHYLEEHIVFELNQEVVDFGLESSITDNDYFILNMSAAIKEGEVDQIKIANSCFLEFDQEFENQIIIEKKGGIKSYRLDHANQSFSIGQS